MLYDGNEDEYEDYYEYPCVSPHACLLSVSGHTCLLSISPHTGLLCISTLADYKGFRKTATGYPCVSRPTLAVLTLCASVHSNWARCSLAARAVGAPVVSAACCHPYQLFRSSRDLAVMVCRTVDDSDALVLPEVVNTGYELLVSRPGKAGMQIIGSRDFRHLYKQKHSPAPLLPGSAEGLRLTYHTVGAPRVPKEEIKQRFKHERRRTHMEMKAQIANDKIYKLPKNVPH